MRTITIEEHFLSTDIREIMRRNSPQAALTRLNEQLADLGPLRLQEMDAAGIDFQVISHGVTANTSLPRDEIVHLMQAANDQLAAAVTAHPDRFAGFAALPMADPQAAVAELKRAVQSLGFKGAMINGTTNGRFLDDPAFFPILEQAVALDVPIYIHPAEPPAAVNEAYYKGFEPAVNFSLSANGWGWHSEVGLHALRMILAGVFDRLPTLQVIIGHMGEMLPFMLARINNTLTSAAKNLQRPVPDYFLQNFHITTSGFFTDPPFQLALQIMGIDRIIFSVDYPYSTNAQGRTFLEHAPVSPADKEKLSHLNAERVLKLPS